MKDKDFEMGSVPGEKVTEPNNHKEHELKTLPEYFENIWTGRKRFEIRLNDRGFKVGDVLILREYNPSVIDCEYSGRTIRAFVTFLLEDVPHLGLQDGFCIMGIQVIGKQESNLIAYLYKQKLQELYDQSHVEPKEYCAICDRNYKADEMTCIGYCEYCYDKYKTTYKDD